MLRSVVEGVNEPISEVDNKTVFMEDPRAGWVGLCLVFDFGMNNVRITNGKPDATDDPAGLINLGCGRRTPWSPMFAYRYLRAGGYIAIFAPRARDE